MVTTWKLVQIGFDESDPKKVRLMAPLAGVLVEPVLRAKCRNPESDHHEAPDFNCKCGIYSFRDLPTLTNFWEEWAEKDLIREDFIIAKMKIFGKIVEHEKGFRSEYAQLEKVYLPVFRKKVWSLREIAINETNGKAQIKVPTVTEALEGLRWYEADIELIDLEEVVDDEEKRIIQGLYRSVPQTQMKGGEILQSAHAYIVSPWGTRDYRGIMKVSKFPPHYARLVLYVANPWLYYLGEFKEEWWNFPMYRMLG